MLRPALTILSCALLLSPAFAETSPPDAGPAAEPCYEAETPILLGTFIEQSGSSAVAAEKPIGVSSPITILVDPPGREPPPRLEPVKTIEPGQ